MEKKQKDENGNERVVKTIKVDQKVHQFLDSERKKGESFSDCLMRILNHRINLDHVTAYLKQRKAIKNMISEIHSIGKLEDEICEGKLRYDYELRFYPSKGNKVMVARIGFSERKAVLEYRGLDSKMERYYSFKNGEENHLSDLGKERFKNYIRGAVRKWVSDADEILYDKDEEGK